DAVARVAFACAAALVGLVASVFHLGRPLLAWRALLGLRTSWLSREALALGLFAGLAILYGALLVLPLVPAAIPYGSRLAAAAPAVGITAALVGALGVLSSVMVYVATRRPHWSAGETGPRFLGTTLLLGAATAIAARSTVAGPAIELAVQPAGTLWLIYATAALKIALEVRALSHARDPRVSALTRRASLMLGPLRTVTAARLVAIAVGGLLVPMWLASGAPAPGEIRLAACAMLLFLTLGELLERILFFSAAPASRMPGAIP
ncbi:MAG TPA: DmsC/YnfH family molybdoenzyme membrane anchor subunit, partial [Candidatus Acidoferrum sp.]|nr:DmsC/YnfH family molybdoenzyme membrane anchor subunit [Candidatus Acidoferrum sp.]